MTLRFCILLPAMMALAACGTGKPVKQSESEQLLKPAHGPWSLVEQKTAGEDPMKEHMEARRQVNPSDQAGADLYTSKTTADDLNEPMHFRVLKLEHQMQGLQEDFDKLLPPLKTLAANDDHLDQTLTEIETRQKRAAAEHIAQYKQAAPPAGLKLAPPPPAPAPETPVTQTPQPQQTAMASEPQIEESLPPAPPPVAPAAGDSGLRVMGVRVGEHPGKVRVVLDMSGPAKFTTDLDNNEKLLLVELPETGWSGSAEKELKNQVVRGYSARPNAAGNGTTLALELKGPSKLLMSEALGPRESYGNRIVLDIAPQ